ncbi:YdcF family protein [Listeria ivanovii]|uniref:YdcF family protein n=1 Tax=Listeria ivanovii TaxID=1638 RepID=UPI0016263B81|nr:YdcF family protein [Listeria ivanovii]MBC2255089.1 YdcF family protein [Listeria ivanovii]
MTQLRKIFIVFIVISLLYLFIVAICMFSGTQTKPSDNAKTVLILGAKVIGEPAQPSHVLQERLDAAVDYLNEHPKARVIVSGGQGADESETEASVMEEYLVNEGIRRARIDTETKSKRTEENISNSKEEFQLGKTVIVTSDYHMYRALMLAKRQNIDATGLPAKSKTIAKYKGMMREVMSITYAWVFDW